MVYNLVQKYQISEIEKEITLGAITLSLVTFLFYVFCGDREKLLLVVYIYHFIND